MLGGDGIETCFPGAVRVGYDPVVILKQLKDRIILSCFPNGWITQTGGGTETLAAVPLTINEMLLQSYEGVVRVFPCWDHSRDASFYQLRAYGAFLVDSRTKGGRVEFVRLMSEKGRACYMENPGRERKYNEFAMVTSLRYYRVTGFISPLHPEKRLICLNAGALC